MKEKRLLDGSKQDKFHYYPFIICINRCDKSCIAVQDPFVGICTFSKS